MDAASLYVGTVMHQRMRPVRHRFTYRVFSLLIDLDRLAEAGRLSFLFRMGRFGLLSFQESDHGDGTGRLRTYIDGVLAGAGVDLAGGTVRLLCYPRLFGYAFNPLAVYYCTTRAGALAALVYEVRNTFGERHTYVARVRAGESDEAGVRQERDKLFYVSPFMGMAMRYRFRLNVPGETLALRILETDAEGPMLAATFFGRHEPLTTARVARAVLFQPLMTLKIVAGIHVEAARLFAKGLRPTTRPSAPPPLSYDGTFVPVSSVEGTPP